MANLSLLCDYIHILSKYTNWTLGDNSELSNGEITAIEKLICKFYSSKIFDSINETKLHMFLDSYRVKENKPLKAVKGIEGYNLPPCSASGWKLLGQEQDGTILVSWESINVKNEEFTSIGLYNDDNENFEVVHSFETACNVVQASINSSKSFLLYVTKIFQKEHDEKQDSNLYEFHSISLSNKCPIETELVIKSNKQIMTQFLCRKKEGVDRFLVFVHKEGISLYQVNRVFEDDRAEVANFELMELVVKNFSWGQWDVQHQCLYYIHYRKIIKTDELGEVKEENISPTLSSLQFNEDVPHETVLNIPVNLPQTLDSPFNVYEDEPIPLRVHDSSLDVIVLSDSRGIVSICHHYLYQPVTTPMIQNDEPTVATEESRVNLAYSVTLLHHGLVVHCKIPGIPWIEASQLKPTFAIHEDDYLFVYIPGILIHLLDLGFGHQPSCHILLPHRLKSMDHWTPIKTPRNYLSLLNSKTLQIFTFDISLIGLMNYFYDKNCGLYNQQSIIHYFLVHRQDFESTSQLLEKIAEFSLNPNVQPIFQEILVSGTYASVAKSLHQDEIKQLRFLPLTTINHLNTIEVKGSSQNMTLTQEALWNPSVMLLTPQQRLCQFRVDLWTQLWNLIADSSCISRFKPSTVAEKLMVSLVCYQNLRELSIHLVKHGLENPLQVHVVATRYAAAQLEMSRFLCSLISKSCAVPIHQLKGFQLIDELPILKRKVYFTILERYACAVDKLAYPLPQGFPSFFTYLAYQTLAFDKFLHYVQARALSLQIDVMKVILPGIDDDALGVKKKLRLLQLLPRSRAKRLLNQWSHPMSLIIRAREHSLNILSGLEPRTHPNRLGTIKGSDKLHNRYTPLDTFLDLLTAKASLAELDFNLLVESTMVSIEKLLRE